MKKPRRRGDARAQGKIKLRKMESRYITERNEAIHEEEEMPEKWRKKKGTNEETKGTGAK
jgi:hypothetical protein